MPTVTPISHLDHTRHVHATGLDWPRIAYLTLLSRAIDDIEETELLKSREVLYQFSARGHDMAQIILASMLNHPGDAAGGYYRSRPLLLALGLDLEDAMAGPMMRSGGMSDGRDIGVVFNLPQKDGKPCVLPMSGGVGTQYTPISGWAESIVYKTKELKDSSCEGAIGVALGGDASTATSGFWAALNSATTRKLPMLFYIEDTVTAFPYPRKTRHRAVTLRKTCPPSTTCLSLTVTAATRSRQLPTSPAAFNIPRGPRSGACTPHSSAPVRAFRSGHTKIQDRCPGRSRKGPRPPAPLTGFCCCRKPDDTGRLGDHRT